MDADGDRLADGLERRLTPHTPARVIVQLRRGATAERVQRLERRAGVHALRRLPLVDAFSARGSMAELRRLAANPAVAMVTADARVSALNDAAQRWFGVSGARLELPALDGDGDGSPASYSSGDLVAAVIDTGIDPGHRELDDGKVLGFKDFVGSGTTPYDDNGHGSHVAGTIAGDGEGTFDGRYRGVAPGAGLVGIKVLDSEGDGWSSDVVAGINWAVANRNTYGIEALNLSLGSTGCDDGTGPEADAVAAARAAGLVVVVSAGNEGPGRCTIGSPGAAPAALTVGAMADVSQGGFYAAGFSSRGPTYDGRMKPDVMAPGVGIASATAGTLSGYSSWSGTSMSAPFVTGVALLMRDAAPAITPDQVKAAIKATAVDFGPAGPDPDWGAGRLDAYAALAAAGAALASPPAMPGHAHVDGSLASGAAKEYELGVDDPSLPLTVTVIRRTALLARHETSLLDPSGAVIETVSSTDRQAVISTSPGSAGTYRLRVKAVSGSGSFDADVSGGLGVTPVDITPDSGGEEPAPADDSGTAPVPAFMDLSGVVKQSARVARRALAARTARKLRRSGGFRFGAAAPAAGRYQVVVRSGTMTVAKGRRSFSAAGQAQLRVRLTRGGKRLFRFAKRAKCAVHVSFTTADGANASAKALTRPRRGAARSRR